jgi:hypothetical protein
LQQQYKFRETSMQHTLNRKFLHSQ